MHKRVRVLICACLLTMAVVGVASAQQAEALQKSDLIRLLTGTTYTKAEVAGIVSRSCLTFTPTARDRTDFESLGATPEILAAIDECLARNATPRVLLVSSVVTVEAGAQATIALRVLRGNRPVSGMDLVLRGSGGLPGGGGADLTATTGSDGGAVFNVSAGTEPGTHSLQIAAAAGELGGARRVRLQVTAAAPAKAEFDPERLVRGKAGPEGEPIKIRLTDAFGNRVPDQPVQLRAGATAEDSALAEGITDERGEVELTVSTRGLTAGERLAVTSGGAPLGFLSIGQDAPSSGRTGFVAGTELSADAGKSLPGPLVFEVRDKRGTPLSGQEVRFSATNGRVSPQAATTDKAGRVEVSLRLGTTVRPTVVTATVGSVRKQASFQATIGGMTPQEIKAALAAAGRMARGGDDAGARSAYERLLEADPIRVGALVGLGNVLLRTGAAPEAEIRFREAYRLEPERADVLKGLGAAALANNDRQEAVRWYETATRAAPRDADAWTGLGEALAAVGRRGDARRAFERAQELDPARARPRREMIESGGRPRLVEVSGWGGNTDGNGRDVGPRTIEGRIWPVPQVELYGGFDNSLNLNHMFLVRGRDDIEEGYGGISADYWRGGTRLTTRFEYGRRTFSFTGLIQTLYTLEQTVHLPGVVSVKVGGTLGHFGGISDNWLAYAGLGFAPVPGVSIEPTLVVGDQAGTNIFSTGTNAERETRFMLLGGYASPAGWGFFPGFAVGNVSTLNRPFDGTLSEGFLRAWAPLGPYGRLEVFLRHQSPPGDPDFTVIGFGLTLGADRPHPR